MKNTPMKTIPSVVAHVAKLTVALSLSLLFSVKTAHAAEPIFENAPTGLIDFKAEFVPNSPPKWLAGEYPKPWGVNVFDPAGAAEFAIGSAPDGSTAFSLVNKNDLSAGQWTRERVQLKPGTYVLSFQYLLTGSGKGRFGYKFYGTASVVKSEGGTPDGSSFIFAEVSTQWKPFTFEIKVTEPAGFGFVFQSPTSGDGNVFYFKGVSLVRTGE